MPGLLKARSVKAMQRPCREAQDFTVLLGPGSVVHVQNKRGENEDDTALPAEQGDMAQLDDRFKVCESLSSFTLLLVQLRSHLLQLLQHAQQPESKRGLRTSIAVQA